jgi:hypothetical protein
MIVGSCLQIVYDPFALPRGKLQRSSVEEGLEPAGARFKGRAHRPVRPTATAGVRPILIGLDHDVSSSVLLVS